MELGAELSQSIQCGVNMHDSTGAFSSLNMQVAVDTLTVHKYIK